MSIRRDFQKNVDEFIAELHEFGTGSYLKEEEKEFWDQPFDPAALPELKSILEKLLDTLDLLSDPEGEDLSKVVQAAIDELEAFNAKHDGAILEPEETAVLNELIHDASAATGAEDEALSELPEID
ncbi:MAG: hypothetical protein Q4G50_06875 [Corynebacterium sp.]|uniref:hypothetical protein n=1 Tax=Corynebacterium sp. TaxID=1720 RepID=UPI0026DFF540|nr:hypothetical protein [Corynebacterium sp.]MDO5669710.1 hypothetical protein [Corynebacterium sp.]